MAMLNDPSCATALEKVYLLLADNNELFLMSGSPLALFIEDLSAACALVASDSPSTVLHGALEPTGLPHLRPWPAPRRSPMHAVLLATCQLPVPG